MPTNKEVLSNLNHQLGTIQKFLTLVSAKLKSSSQEFW